MVLYFDTLTEYVQAGAELVRQGVTFTGQPATGGGWKITLKGGF